MHLKDNILVDYNILFIKKSSFFHFLLIFFLLFDKIGLMENLIDELTAKNKEYVHAVTKQLMLVGKSDDEVKTILNELLPQIIEGQKTATPARKLLGTPTEFVDQYVPKAAVNKKNSNDKNSNDKPVWMWLDSTLLFFGFIYLVTGAISLFSPKSAQVYGLVTTIIMAALAGLVMYMIYKFYYAQTGERRKWNWKQMLLVVAVVLVWSAFSTFSVLLPRAINPVFNSYITVLIGVIALVVKYLLKRKFHIRSTLAPMSTVQK